MDGVVLGITRTVDGVSARRSGSEAGSIESGESGVRGRWGGVVLVETLLLLLLLLLYFPPTSENGVGIEVVAERLRQ